MKGLNRYIVEKLHLNKDNTDNLISLSVLEQLATIINNYMTKEVGLKTTHFIYMFEDDKGKAVNTKDENKLARIYLYANPNRNPNMSDISDIVVDLEKQINKIKKIKKTEVYSKSAYFYFVL